MFINEELMIRVTHIDKRKGKLLENKEPAWRIKIRAFSLEKSDQNTKFFQHYVVHRKRVNTVWKIKMNDCSMTSIFEDIARVGVDPFNEI